jgi:methanogenic corrinoid protein MtbC1
MTPPRDNKAVTLSARIAALDEAGSLDAIRARVAAGDDPLTIIAECQLGMRYVGEHYQSGKYFISGLIMAGEIFREAMEILEPLLPAARQSAREPVVGGVTLLCTVRGDIHDIGKSIVVTLLRSHGFTVHDLGVDVPPSEVARETRELRPDVVGLSGLLTSTHASMKETVAEVRRCAPQPGHRPPVIIIGGSAVDEQVRAWTGADLWADDAVRGVELIRDRLSRL